jgi:tetratricopeptide (TPR) repeat protein/predicted Ser/Thr protein kinase
MSLLLTHPPPSVLRAYATNELPPHETDAINRHLVVCPDCRRTLDALLGGTATPVSQLTPPPDFAAGRPSDAQPTRPSPLGRASVPQVQTPGVPPQLNGHPRYRVLKVLGEGGMGTVYLAEQVRMGRKVALKVIHPHLLHRDSALPRFLHEVRAAARLSHPNIVQAFDADEAGGMHFFVMEYVKGMTLAKYLEREGPLPVHVACHFARQAAHGLQHAHEHGMIHRDIKPQNLMLTAKGQLKVLDFGLARLAGRHGQFTGAGIVVGTADYMAPEQTKDSHTIDTRADIYALGCTLYQMLSGRVPFSGGTDIEKMIKHAMDAPPPLRDLRPDLPEALYAVVDKMMAKAPEDRFQVPADAARALAPFVHGHAQQPAPAPRAPSVPALQHTSPVLPPVVADAPPPRRRVARWAALALALCAAGAATALALRAPRGELALETVCDDVDVLVKQNGTVVTVLDVNRPRVALPDGRYALVVELGKDGKPRDDVAISLTEADVKRGERVTAVVRRVPKQPRPADGPKPTGDPLAAQAQAALDAGQFARASELAAQALTANPNDVPALLVRSAALGRLGRWAEAETDADAAVTRAPNSYSAWLARGAARLNLQKPQLAACVADVTRAMELGAGGATPYGTRGTARALSGDYAAALPDLNRHLELLPAGAPVRAEELRIRGYIRLRTGDETGARADAAEALKLNPNVDKVPRVAHFRTTAAAAQLQREAETAARSGGHARAAELATQALQIDPLYAPALVTRADARCQLGLWAEADRDATAARDREPCLFAAWHVHGWARLNLSPSDPSGCVLDSTRALELGDPRPHPLMNRADARVRLSEFAAARADCDLALARLPASGPERAWAYRLRGYLRERLGDAAGARADESAALTLDPKVNQRPNPLPKP